MVVSAPGVAHGKIIARGHRAFCPNCGYMSTVVGYRTAQRYSTKHRKECNGAQ